RRRVERVVAGHVGEQGHAEVGGGGGHEPQHELVEPADDLGAGQPLGGGQVVDVGLEGGDDPLHRLVHGGVVQLVLGGEVPVEVGLGDPGPFGDVPQAAAGPAALHEDLPGGGDDQLPAGLGRQAPAAGRLAVVVVHVVDLNRGPLPTIRQWRRRPARSGPGSGPRSAGSGSSTPPAVSSSRPASPAPAPGASPRRRGSPKRCSTASTPPRARSSGRPSTSRWNASWRSCWPAPPTSTPPPATGATASARSTRCCSGSWPTRRRSWPWCCCR